MRIHVGCRGTKTIDIFDGHRHQQHRHLREGDHGGAHAAAEAGCEHAVRGTAAGEVGEEKGDE